MIKIAIANYVICGAIYAYYIDYIGRKLIKDHTKEPILRPFKFSFLHLLVVVIWPYFMIDDLIHLIKYFKDKK